MNCSNCSTQNPADAAFCMKCGTKLDVGCPTCGASIPEGAAFCMKCGTKVGGDQSPTSAPAEPSPPRAAPAEDKLRQYIPHELLEKLEAAARAGGSLQGERRRVTMLFCDIQGSSAAAQYLDPEDWADVMNGVFEHLITPVYEYEGTIARLMGDAILAFFGAPIAHEDDPERAIKAGLEIIERVRPYAAEVKNELGIELDVRVGINTGLVVVGAVGTDLRVEYTAMGDAVNVAARMEQTAAPGTVQVSDDTKQQAEKLFEFEDLGPIDVKGRNEPVRSWRVNEAVDRPQTIRGIDGLSAPLIGRDVELATLVDVLGQVSAGAGAVVSVLGEAGLGKSRLMAEFRKTAGDIDWHEGRSLSYETTTAYAPARGILRSALGLPSSPSPDLIWERVEEMILEHDPAKVSELAPFISSLLGGTVPERHQHRLNYLQPPAAREATIDAVARLVEGLTSRRPCVIVFEDLHWADSASLEIATRLATVAEHSQLLLVLIYRPRRGEGSWQVRETIERSHPHLHHSIDLQPLDEEHGRTLIAELLAIDGLPDDVRDLVLQRSDGNPYFLEEVIRSMIDAGVVAKVDNVWTAVSDVRSVMIPDTLAALITTRLDSLNEFCRSVAQAASVIGREFRYEEVAAIVDGIGDLDGSLVELRRRDLIRETARVPRRVYRFKHALVQETAYQSLLRKDRTRLHASAAAFLERTQPDRVEDIADHYVDAGRFDKALPHLVAAGERAAAAYLLPEAEARLDLSLEHLDSATPHDLVKRALEASGGVRQAQFDLEGATGFFTRLVEEGDARGHAPMRISGTNKLAFIKGLFMGQTDEALADLSASEQLAMDATDNAGLIEACISQCYVRTGQADFDQVEYYMDRVAKIGLELGQTEPTLFGMVHHSNTLVYQTKFDEARVMAEKTLAKAEELGHLKFQAEILTFPLPATYLRDGDVEGASAFLERGMEIALQIGDRQSEMFAAIFQGKIATNRGQFDEAIASFKRALEAAQATGIPYAQALGTCTAGTCYSKVGGPMLAKAQDLHAETLELMELPTGTVLGAWVWSEVGHCSMLNGDTDLAEELFNRAIDTMTAPVWVMRPLALAGLVKVALSRDNLDEAQSRFDTLREYVTERKMTDHYLDVEMLGAELAIRRGDHQSALTALARTRQMSARAGLKRMLIDALVLTRAAHLVAGDEAGAAATESEIARIGSEIASGIRDDEVRSAFKTEIASLLTQSN